MWVRRVEDLSEISVARRRDIVPRAEVSTITLESTTITTTIFTAILAPTPAAEVLAAVSNNATSTSSGPIQTTMSYEALLTASSEPTATSTDAPSSTSASISSSTPVKATDAPALDAPDASPSHTTSTKERLAIAFGSVIGTLLLIVLIYVLFRMRKGYTLGEIVRPPRRRKSSYAPFAQGPTSNNWRNSRSAHSEPKRSNSDEVSLNLQSNDLPVLPQPSFLRPDTSSSERPLVSAAGFPAQITDEPQSPRVTEGERSFSVGGHKRTLTPPRIEIPPLLRPPTPPKDNQPDIIRPEVTIVETSGDVSPLSDTLPKHLPTRSRSASSTYSAPSPIPTYLQDIAQNQDPTSPPKISRFSWTNSQAPKTPNDHRYSVETTTSTMPRYRTVESWVGNQTTRLGPGPVQEHLAREIEAGLAGPSSTREAGSHPGMGFGLLSPSDTPPQHYQYQNPYSSHGRKNSLLSPTGGPRRMASPIPEQDSSVAAAFPEGRNIDEEEELAFSRPPLSPRKNSADTDATPAPLPLLLPNRQLDWAMRLEQQQQQQQQKQQQQAAAATPIMSRARGDDGGSGAHADSSAHAHAEWPRREKRETAGSDLTCFKAHPGTLVVLAGGSRVPSEILDERVVIVPDS